MASGECTRRRMGRREALRAGARAIFAATVSTAARTAAAADLAISNRYSPMNAARPARPHTRYIVLHTTEGSQAGSLSKIYQRGEAHYFVTQQGTVYRVIDKDKIATHAGRSMWEGHRNIDHLSIGIEVVGFHNQDIEEAQYPALRELIRQLRSIYRVGEEDVVTHSMVAYGRPNRFHRSHHRGRKRCGMIFARPDVRARLGLSSKPERDRDVEAGRLAVADPELHRFLYTIAPSPAASGPAAPPGGTGGLVPVPAESMVIDKGWTAWSIARELYNQPDTVYVFPNGTRSTGDKISDWNSLPAGTRVLLGETGEAQGFEGFLEIGKDGETSADLAGEAFTDRTTIYFFPDGLIRTGWELQRRRSTRGLLANPPKGTRVLVGYVYGGYATTRRPPSAIAGVKWNYPSTFYRLPGGSILSGDEIDPHAIPARTLVFYQH